ncbi:MAG: hypothetical protein GC160_16020 [Acidobacteria bacterium]|nr:hypothetical protein [Acidobacteriota bacterium]
MRSLSLLLLTVAVASAQNPYERMLASQQMVELYLIAEARKLTDRSAAEMRSRQDWEPHIEQRRREMREMLGLEPPPPKTPLNVQITGRIERDGYVIEKIAFESLPKVYVTANLYLPTGETGKVPGIVYVCGHAYSPQGSKTYYQRHGHTLAKAGHAALIIDPIQIAELFALHHGIHNNEMYDWYARGYTPAGVEVWNVIRALDYLETRPEIDASKLGITGRSGGAAMSWFPTAIDERLKVAVPVMGISTYAANVEANTQKGHCDCMFLVNSRMHDMLHQGALIAPRPLLMGHGVKDALFPVPGYEEFERTMKRLYSSYGRSEQYRNMVVDTGHADSDYLRAEAVKWFDQHLVGRPAREIDVSYEEVAPEELAVFGGHPPEDALNYRVHEVFAPPHRIEPPSTLAEWETRRTELLKTLREKVFMAFPDEPPPLNIRAGSTPAPKGFEALAFDSEEGVTIEALWRKPEGATGPALVWVASDREDLDAISRTLRQVSGSETNPLLIVWPRGVGEVPWPKTVWKDMLRNSMHLGRSVDSMRLWDVLRAVEVVRERAPGAEVAVAGDGASGALGLYAGVLDEGIAQAILLNAPTTHFQGPLFLDVLRYTDLPEAAGLMAPRRVTFYGKVPPEYAMTQGVFTLYGKPGNMSLSMSIEGALNGRFGHDYASGL